VNLGRRDNLECRRFVFLPEFRGKARATVSTVAPLSSLTTQPVRANRVQNPEPFVH